MLLIAAFLCLGACPAVAAADDPATALYQPGRVDVIELGLSPTAKAKLEAEPEEYVEATFSLAETDGTPAGKGSFSIPQKAEIRLKGGASFKTLAGKAAFKVKFPKEAPFLGLRKMTLNNMVEDPSMAHETLAYAAFRAAGVPAPRTSFAYVYVNGVDYGLHLDLETLDNVALAKLFGSFDKKTQHLYEGEDGADVRPGGAAEFEIDEGEESRADLEALIAAVNGSGPPAWSTRVAPFADLGEMTRMWAVEKYVGQRDGYASGASPFQPNNYYLFSDPGGRFQMLPWGMDESWQEGNHLGFGSGHGLLFTGCLADASCTAAYRQSLAAACGAIGGAGLGALLNSTATLLAPWQQLEQGNSRHQHSLAEAEEALSETSDFLASRPSDAVAFLGEQCASSPTPSTPSTPPTTPASATAKPDIGAPGTSEAPVGFEIGRARFEDGLLQTDLRLPAAGAVTQRVTIATAAGAVVVGGASAEVKRARDLTLNCRLSAALRERLRARWLRIGIATTFVPSGGEPRTISRRLVLKRQVG
jgi:hypothetical protein